MLSVLCLHRCLTQEVLAFRELSKELVVKVISVSNDNDGRLRKDLLYHVGVEYHRK